MEMLSRNVIGFALWNINKNPDTIAIQDMGRTTMIDSILFKENNNHNNRISKTKEMLTDCAITNCGPTC